MSNDKTLNKDDVVAEILQKAGEDSEFKAMLFSNPQQALAHFDVVIPGAFGKDYTETVYAAFDRADFYIWFKEKILDELRDKTASTAPGHYVSAAEQDDVDWDFEVTKYKPWLLFRVNTLVNLPESHPVLFACNTGMRMSPS